MGPDGSTIQNIISDGPGGGDENLHLTYVFELLWPDVEAGSKKDEELQSQFQNESEVAVPHTIEVIRKLVVAGEL